MQSLLRVLCKAETRRLSKCREFLERTKERARSQSDPDSGRLGRRPGEEVPTAASGWVGFSQARGCHLMSP